MKKKGMMTTAVLAACLLASGGAFAGTEGYRSGTGEGAATGTVGQERATTGQQDQQRDVAQADKSKLKSADDLTDFKVTDQRGEEVGSVSQVLIDVQSGQVGYAIISSNGVLGMGGDEYIVPFSALSPGQEEETLMMNIQRDQLQQAPDDLEQISRSQEQQIHQHYGLSPYWEESGAQRSDQFQQDQLQQQQPDQMQQERTREGQQERM